MKRAILSLVICCGVLAAVLADDVYVLRPADSGGSLWSQRMGLSAEVAAMHAPLRFSYQGSQLRLVRLSNLDYQVHELGPVARLAAGSIYHYRVAFRNTPALGNPSLRLRVRIPLASLSMERPWSDSPSVLAIQHAIKESGLREGRAWVESIVYNEGGEFLVLVALLRD